MKIRKDLVIAVLVTFCLTTTLFMVKASWSGGEWDPWVDIKEDGTVDIYDAITLANAYGTSGDTTKNVTIVGHASKLAYNITTSVPAGQQFTTPWILVDGYSKISVCVYNVAAIDSYSLTTRHTGYISEWYVDHQVNATGDIVKTYDVPNQEIRIICENNDAGSRTLSLDIYLLA